MNQDWNPDNIGGRRKLLPLPQARFRGGEFATLHSHFFLPEITWIFTDRLYKSQYSPRCLLQGNARKRKFITYWPNKSLKQIKKRKKFLDCLHVLKFVKVFKLDVSTYQRSSACVGGPVALQPSSLCLRSLSRFFSCLPSVLDFLTVDCIAASVLLANCTS